MNKERNGANGSKNYTDERELRLENNIKHAFDQIHAEASLVERTRAAVGGLSHARGSMGASGKSGTVGASGISGVTGKSGAARAFRAACAVCAACIVFISFGVYFSPAAFVNMEVNPSIGLDVNVIGRVVGVSSFNEDGLYIAENVRVKHKSYESAVDIIMLEMERSGFLDGGGLVSVALKADNGRLREQMLQNIESGVSDFMQAHSHGGKTETDIFTIGGDTLQNAHSHGISPAKYYAIMRLIEVDNTVTVEACKNHSIDEIRQIMNSHGGNHGKQGNHGNQGNQGNELNQGNQMNYGNHQMNHGENRKNHGGGRH